MDGPLLEKVKEAILEVFHFGDANPSLVTKPPHLPQVFM
jgi:hypothetical protein